MTDRLGLGSEGFDSQAVRCVDRGDLARVSSYAAQPPANRRTVPVRRRGIPGDRPPQRLRFTAQLGTGAPPRTRSSNAARNTASSRRARSASLQVCPRRLVLGGPRPHRRRSLRALVVQPRQTCPHEDPHAPEDAAAEPPPEPSAPDLCRRRRCRRHGLAGGRGLRRSLRGRPALAHLPRGSGPDGQRHDRAEPAGDRAGVDGGLDGAVYGQPVVFNGRVDRRHGEQQRLRPRRQRRPRTVALQRRPARAGASSRRPAAATSTPSA